MHSQVSPDGRSPREDMQIPLRMTQASCSIQVPQSRQWELEGILFCSVMYVFSCNKHTFYVQNMLEINEFTF
jgi:hypothetical protein